MIDPDLSRVSLAECALNDWEVTVYCLGACRGGRPLDLLPVSLLNTYDKPIAALTRKRKFRCSRCGGRAVSVIVSRRPMGQGLVKVGEWGQ
jgi:hypothetical protein